jgi:pyruvate dehydrogenase E2 component (dihydrolipoamide acetyltransferase)
MIPFQLPDLGEGLKEAEIVAWHVAEGDHVVIDQPLVSVETEKAVVEIPSPRSGRIAQFLARPGEHVQVGQPLLAFEEGVHPDSGTVVGELAAPAAHPISPRQRPPDRAPPIHAAPAVRARARELGVNLARVVPSSGGERFTLADVESAAATSSGSLAAGEELRGARRTMALSMSRAGREVVPATLHDEAGIEPWSSADITVRLIRAMIAGCSAEPRLNASFDGTRLSLRINSQIDVGLAIDSAEGLFVPVLRDVAQASAAELRVRINDLKARVRDRKLMPEELRSPTITLSNFGTIAGRYAALVVVPPQVAILGAGRIIERPARDDNGLALRDMLPLSLTFDHRAVTGGEAARFLRAVIADLESPTDRKYRHG